MYGDIVWEISTGRCMRTIHVGGIVRSIDWCPNKALSLVTVAADRKLLLINPGVGDTLIVKKTDSILRDASEEAFAGMILSIVYIIIFKLSVFKICVYLFFFFSLRKSKGCDTMGKLFR